MAYIERLTFRFNNPHWDRRVTEMHFVEMENHFSASFVLHFVSFRLISCLCLMKYLGVFDQIHNG